MTKGLIQRAKLFALITGLVIAMAACAEPAKNDSAEPTATTSSAAQATETATPVASVAQDAIGGELFLKVDSPTVENLFVTTDNVQVTGHTTIDALLSVNDSVLEIDSEGKFVHTVQLEEGPNLIEVVASDVDGHQMDEVLLVIYEPA